MRDLIVSVPEYLHSFLPWSYSYFVWFCGFCYKAFHVESKLAPCFNFFSVLFNIVITSLGKQRDDLYASRAFVCLSCIRYFLSFFLCLLVLWVECSL